MVPPDVRWIFPLLSIAISSINAICLDPRPTRLLLCYQASATPELNPCSCTHLVHQFTDIRRIDNQSGFLKSGQKHKEKNPDLKLIASISGQADDLLKDRNITARKLASALDEAQLDGVELNVNWNNSQVQKQSLIDLIKKLIDEFDGKTSNRVKRHYDVIEQQTDDVTTVAWSKQIKDSKDLNSSQSRVVRESVEAEDEYYDDNESNSAKSEDEKEGTKHEETEKKSENPFTIILRLPSRPQTLAKHYDLKQLNKYVDYFVLNTHNISDPAEANLTHHPSRLMGINDVQNADSLIDLVTGLGVAQSKIVMAVPSTATQFTLKNATNNMPQSETAGAPVTLTQKQMCQLMSNGTWTVERDEDLTAPYAFNNATWVAFDDSTSASIKGKYVLLRELGGLAVMNIEAEDWSNDCTQPGPTILSTLYDTLSNIGRKTRAAQLYSLQEQLHQASPFSFAADVQVSPYRVARVVDRAGDIHVVRRQIKTEFQCSRQGYFTHPSGCNRFYRCVKFNQYVEDYTVFEYDCPAGLAFDERYEVCVWPGSLPDGGACQGSSEIAPVPRNRYVCPAVEGYYADPENCRWFFACLDHARDGVTPLTAYEFRCPFGLVFNEAQLVCDWPWNVQGCGQSGYAGARLTVGDLYEGRLRPSYATLPDYYVSGGRIQGGNAGLVLGSNLAGIPGVNQYDASGSAYPGFGGNSGIQYEGGSSNQYAEAIKAQQVGGAQLYSGSRGQYPGLNGGGYGSAGLQYSSGGALYANGQGKLYSAGGIGGKQSLYSGATAVPYVGGSVGLYASDYAHDNSGAYVHDNSGDYVHDNSGDYVHDDKGYIHDGRPYVHQGDKYGNGGQYIHQSSGSYGKSEGGAGGAYSGASGSSGGAYAQDNSGAYVRDNKGYYQGKEGYGNAGQYNHQFSGNYGKFEGGIGGAYSGGSGASSGAYVNDNSGAYVNSDKGYYQGKEIYGSGGFGIQGGAGKQSLYSGATAVPYVGGSVGLYASDYAHENGGAYVHDHTGDYVHDNSGDYVHDGRPYVHQEGKYGSGSQYIHQSSGGSYSGASGASGGAYVHDGSGAYTHDDKGYYQGKESYGDQYVKISGVKGQYAGNEANVYINTPLASGQYSSGKAGYSSNKGAGYFENSGAYNHDESGDFDYNEGGKYSQGFAQKGYSGGYVKAPQPSTYISKPVGVYKGSYDYNSPVVTVTTAAPVAISSVHPHVSTVSGLGLYHTPQPVSYVTPTAYTTGFVSTPAPPVAHFSPVVSTPSPPVAHFSPVVSTYAPPVAHYSPVVSTPAPPVAHYSPVVSTPAPPVAHFSPVVSTPAPPVAHFSPVVSTVAPSVAHYSPVVPVSTPAPPIQYHTPLVSPAVQYSLPSVSQRVTPFVYQTPVSTPAPPAVYDSAVHVTTPAPPVAYRVPSTPAPSAITPKIVPVSPIVTPAPPVLHYSPAAVSAPGAYAYNSVPVSTGAAYYSTPSPPVAFGKYAPSVSTTLIASTPKPVTYYQSPTVTPAPVYKKVTVAPTPAPVFLSNTASAYNYVTPTPQPVVFKSPAPINYNPYHTGVTSVTSLPYVSHVTPCSIKEHASYAEHEHLPIVSITPAVEYQRPHYNVDYSYHRQPVAPVVPAIPLAPVTPKPVLYEYKQPVAPVVPVTPAPEVIHYQSVTPPPVRYEYKAPPAPVVPVTPAPVVHYPPPPPVRFEYKQPVVPVVTPAPVVPVQYGYRQPVSPVIPVTPAPEVVHYPSVTPSPPPVRFEYKQPVPVVPVTPAPEVVHYQSVTPPPVPVSYGYKQPVTPIVPVTPAPEVIHYQSVTPAPAPVRFEYKQPIVPIKYPTAPPAPARIPYTYQAPVIPIKQVSQVPVVHYEPVPTPPPTPVKYQYSYKQPLVPVAPVTEDYRPIVPVTTPTPVTYSTPQYSYQTPVRPVAPLVTYSVPRRPSISYTTVAPVTPVKEIFYKEPVTTLAPIYKQPTVISSYAYNKDTDAPEEAYTPAPEKEEYYQSPPAFSYSYKAPIKPALPASGYYVQQGIAAPTYAPVAYGYKEVDTPSLKPIVVAPYTPAPTFVSVTTPKCESPAVHLTSTPIAYYTPTTTSAPLTTASLDYGAYNDKLDYGTKTTAKVKYVNEKLPDQYLVEVAPTVGGQYESGVDVNRGYKATVHTGSNIYYKSGSGSGSYSDDKAFETFEADNYPSGYTSTTQKPSLKPVYYSSRTKLPVVATTEAYVPQQYSSESDEKEDELDISNEDSDDHLVSQYDSQFGSKSTEYTTAVSSTANLREGDTIVGVVKDGRSRFTGQKKKKVVVVSRLSDFNPLLVNKLGAQCDCTPRIVRKRRPRPKSTTEALFDPVQTTTVSYEPSYSPSYTTLESDAPVVEIRPAIRRRKVNRSTTTSTTESYSNDVDNDDLVRRVVPSKQRVGLRNKPAYRAQPSEEQEYNNDPTNVKESEDLMNGRVECKRAGLFRHPKYCNKFYSCNWDKWKKKFTLNILSCPIHLAYDSELGACNWPSKGPACSDNNLLV